MSFKDLDANKLALPFVNDGQIVSPEMDYLNVGKYNTDCSYS